jgi:hypothetical protein
MQNVICLSLMVNCLVPQAETKYVIYQGHHIVVSHYRKNVTAAMGSWLKKLNSNRLILRQQDVAQPHEHEQYHS